MSESFFIVLELGATTLYFYGVDDSGDPIWGLSIYTAVTYHKQDKAQTMADAIMEHHILPLEIKERNEIEE